MEKDKVVSLYFHHAEKTTKVNRRKKSVGLSILPNLGTISNYLPAY